MSFTGVGHTMCAALILALVPSAILAQGDQLHGDVIGLHGVDVVINSSQGKVLVKGVDILAELSELRNANLELQARVQSLEAEFMRHNAPTDAPTTSPTMSPASSMPTALPTSSMPTAMPSMTPTFEPTEFARYPDCLSILSNNAGSRNGIYTIRPSRSSQSFQVYCDMDSGGWTQIGTIQSPSSNHWNTWGGGYWTNTSTINYPQGHAGGSGRNSDYKSPGWNYLVVGTMRIISTNGVRHMVEARNNQACRGQTMAQIYGRNNMIAQTATHGCGCPTSTIRHSGVWDRIGMAGCSDNSNENTLLSLTASNAGGYFHNRPGSCVGRNLWGTFGNCAVDATYGGAIIFVKQ